MLRLSPDGLAASRAVRPTLLARHIAASKWQPCQNQPETTAIAAKQSGALHPRAAGES